MSLDVYLTTKGTVTLKGESIFIREDGQVKEISREEWGERYPDREPVAMPGGFDDSGEVFTANITHNLNGMASEAGIYKCLWRPDENGISKASQLIEPLREGLALLESDPERFRQFNPPNGWGTYEGLVGFVRSYLAACERYPGAEVSVWR